jgi:hypothetical protein
MKYTKRFDRYVGGAGTMVMIEALKSLSPAAGEGHSPLSPAESRRPEKGNISSLNFLSSFEG